MLHNRRINDALRISAYAAYKGQSTWITWIKAWSRSNVVFAWLQEPLDIHFLELLAAKSRITMTEGQAEKSMEVLRTVSLNG
jgi:hypothetical protein